MAQSDEEFINEIMNSYAQADEPAPEAVDVAEEISDSSLTETEETATTEPIKEPVAEKPQLTDDDVRGYLSERLKRDISSIDELGERLSTEPAKFANDELKVLNDYIANTGRTVDDYFKTQRVNLDETNAETLAMAMLVEQNPTLSEDEIQFLFEEEYEKKNPVKIDEDIMSDLEVEQAKEHNAKVERSNKLRDIKMKRAAEEARKYFKEVQEKYKMPVREAAGSEFDKQSFKEALASDIQELKELNIDLGDGSKFTYEVSQKETKKAITPNELIADFRKPDGTFDVQKWNTLMYMKDNIGNVVKAATVRARSEGREALEREMKNTTLGSSDAQGTANVQRANGISEIIDQLYG